MKNTKEQDKIITDIPISDDNFSIKAEAGSGKTTTLVQLSKSFNTGLSISFTNRTVDELKERFPNKWTISTTHKLGHGLLLQYMKTNISKPFYKVTNGKYPNIITKLMLNLWFKDIYKIDATVEETAAFLSFYNRTKFLVDFIRLTHTDFNNREAIISLAKFYGETVEDIHIQTAQTALNKGIENFKWKGFRDFNDMLWLPLVMDLKPQKQYSTVMVDELQDLNLAQHNLIKLFMSRQIIGVGDPAQSMYGFAGSDSESFEKFNESFECTQLPLSYCFRCPTNHIDLIHQLGLNTSILAAPNAIEGNLEFINYEELAYTLNIGDCVISRIGKYQKDKPNLISLMKELIQLGKPVKLLGYNPIIDIEEVLKLAGNNIAFSNFASTLLSWFEFTKQNMLDEKKPDFNSIKELEENVYTTLEFFNIIRPKNKKEFIKKIKELCFNENGVLLSTVHKAKGGEWDNVYILNYNDMPMIYERMQQWQIQQEKNILHVALTRSKQNLTLVQY